MQLRDPFFSDRHGRKVVVIAESRRIAACAIKTVLFQLAHAAGRATDLAAAQWCYLSPAAGSRHGPFPFRKMATWAERNAFGSDAMPVQHAESKCWLPLWFMLHVEASTDARGARDRLAGCALRWKHANDAPAVARGQLQGLM